MGKLIALALFVSALNTPASLRAQRDPENDMGKVLSTGRPVELPRLEKSKHIPTRPDEIVPEAPERNSSFDPVEARRSAEELADLAGKIPAQIDQVSKNILPKDLIKQLKEIEKLAKRLRQDVSRTRKV
jgi:hypothetical protein